MKTSILILAAICSMNALIAQTPTTNSISQVPTPHDGIVPPSVISNKFGTDYPTIHPNWNMEGENYSAEYRDEKTNTGHIIIYDRNGNIIRTDNELNTMTYPSTIGDYYHENYPNESYKVWSSEDNTGSKTYYSKRKSGTIWFDKNGKYVSTKPVKSTTKSNTKK